MGVVVTEEEQAPAEDLAEARRLIVGREYGMALDALEAARESALAGGDAAALEGVWELSRTVWVHAPAESPNSLRAAVLGRLVVADLGALRPGRRVVQAGFGNRDARPRRMARHRELGVGAKAAVWTLVVWGLALVPVLVRAAAEDIYMLQALFVLVPVAFAIWAIGLLVIYLRRSRPDPQEW